MKKKTLNIFFLFNIYIVVSQYTHRFLKRTCIEFPPVDLSEEGLSPELIAGAISEAEPTFWVLHQQAIADGAGLLTELLRINHWIVQDALLHHLIFHLEKEIKRKHSNTFTNSKVKPFIRILWIK